MPSFSLTDLENRVWNRLDGNSAFFPAENARLVLNEGLRRLNLITAFYQGTVAVALGGGFTVAGQQLYAVPAGPSGIVIPQRVYVEQKEIKKVSLEELAEKFRTWTEDSTASRGPIMRWAPIGMTQFVIHPFDSVGGRLLEVQGVAPVPAMVNPGDLVTLEDHNVDILVDYGRSRMMLKEGGKPFADASIAYQQMIHKLKRMARWANIVWPRYFVQGFVEGDSE